MLVQEKNRYQAPLNKEINVRIPSVIRSVWKEKLQNLKRPSIK